MNGPSIVCAGCGKPCTVLSPLCAECARVTLIMCGPTKCDHDYSGEGTAVEGGWTAICTKCGAHAIDEAVWE